MHSAQMRYSFALQGMYAEAELLYEESQAIREKTLGREHPDVASSLSNKARLLTTQVIETLKDISTRYPTRMGSITVLLDGLGVLQMTS